MHIFNWEVDQEILKTFRAEMLVKPQAQLLAKDNGFNHFVRSKDFDNLKLFYSLFKEEAGSMKPICDQYRSFIKE